MLCFNKPGVEKNKVWGLVTEVDTKVMGRAVRDKLSGRRNLFREHEVWQCLPFWADDQRT